MHRLIGGISCLAFAAFMLMLRWYGMKTGELPVKGRAVYRDKFPRIFRYAQMVYAALAGLAIIVAVAIASGFV